jgi:hypothetical protein
MCCKDGRSQFSINGSVYSKKLEEIAMSDSLLIQMMEPRIPHHVIMSTLSAKATLPKEKEHWRTVKSPYPNRCDFAQGPDDLCEMPKSGLLPQKLCSSHCIVLMDSTFEDEMVQKSTFHIGSELVV